MIIQPKKGNRNKWTSSKTGRIKQFRWLLIRLNIMLIDRSKKFNGWITRYTFLHWSRFCCSQAPKNLNTTSAFYYFPYETWGIMIMLDQALGPISLLDKAWSCMMKLSRSWLMVMNGGNWCMFLQSHYQIIGHPLRIYASCFIKHYIDQEETIEMRSIHHSSSCIVIHCHAFIRRIYVS